MFWKFRLLATPRPSFVAVRDAVPADALTKRVLAISVGLVESLLHAAINPSDASAAALRARVKRSFMSYLLQR